MKDALKLLLAAGLMAALYALPGLEGVGAGTLWMGGTVIFIALCFLLERVPLGFHLAIGWLLVIETLRQVCQDVPMYEKVLGESYLIFYFHFPSAIGCLAFFLIAGVISAMQLVSGAPRLDQRAASLIEIGVVACSITLVTGMTWAQAAWGKPWVWNDKRLMTVAIMWFTYMAYLMFRLAVDDPVKRARFSSVLGIIFALNVPLVWFAIRWFGQVSHPMQLTMEGEQRLAMTFTRWFGAAAFFILYLAIWRLRCRSMQVEDRVERLEEAFMRQKI